MHVAATPPTDGLELRSIISSDATLKLSLASVPLGDPGPDEVIVRVEAAPINPSDLGLLLGPADLSTMKVSDSSGSPVLTAQIPPAAMDAVRARLDQSLPVGNEGAGTVVAAGPDASHLTGARVGVRGPGMYAQYRRVRIDQCTVLPPDASAAEGAAMYINPLAALGFVETMKAEGHRALVHTAAASTLGQMLVRICQADGIPLVNVVRGAQQVALLTAAGSDYVLDSMADDFDERLADAISATGATIAFDAIGGGTLAQRLLHAMEVAAARTQEGAYSRYGSSVHKQVYIYGNLDTGPTVLHRTFGAKWGCGGWLLTDFLSAAGNQTEQRLRQRVVDELTTTFASNYAAHISLADVLRPDVIRQVQHKSTGQKYLIVPERQ